VSAGTVRTAVILCGARGSGKTTVCLEFSRAHTGCAGIVCPTITEADRGEVGKSALCLHTGESWELARSDSDLDGPRYGRFRFSAAGITRAVDCLRAALQDSGRICVVDEIGPLEMDLGMGFAPVLPLLQGAWRLLIAARPGLEARIAAYLPRHACSTVRIDAPRRGQARAEAVAKAADEAVRFLLPAGS
jgi:iron complex transport system ATP-binding protein